jgi:hypothetical protein
MSLTNYAEQAVLNLLFINQSWANVGDTIGIVGSTANGNLYISLHTSDPGETANQLTAETAYTSYSRVPVFRGPNNFTLSTSTISNITTISFPTCSGGSSSITHFGIGTQPTGSGDMIATGNLSATLAVSSGIAPTFSPGALTATID